MRIEKFRIVLVLGLSIALSSACGKKDSDDGDDTAGTKLTKVESIDQLNVSGSLAITLPDSFEESSAALHLTAKKRSMEACRMGQTLKEVTKNLGTVGSFFCHLEVEAAKIKFGTKYKITTNGEDFGSVWADNSKAADGKISLYMCEDGKLKEKIEVTGVDVDRGAAKGSLHTKGSEGEHSWASAVVFDVSFTDENLVSIQSQDKYTDSSTDGSFARAVDMNIYEKGKGISTLSLSSKGNWGGHDFADKAFARHNGDYGHALVEGSGTQGEEVFEYTHNAYFDDNGNVVDSDATKAFDAGGELDVKDSEMPAYLKASFEPDEAEGWKCNTDETVDLDPESKAHQACDEGKEQDEFANCWGEDFEQGEDVE